jgi:hypothetical protein
MSSGEVRRRPEFQDIFARSETMATRHTFGGSSQHFNGNLGQEDTEGKMGQMRHAAEAVPQQARQVVEEYPLSTVLAVFGLGLGVGACVGMAMFSPSSSYSSSSWFPSMSSSGSSSWFPSMSSSGSSSWFPSMSSHGSSSWLPSGSNQSWFGNGSSNWSDNLMKSAKSACGY